MIRRYVPGCFLHTRVSCLCIAVVVLFFFPPCILALQILPLPPVLKLSPLLLLGQSASFTKQWTKRNWTTYTATFLCSWHCQRFLITVRAMYLAIVDPASNQQGRAQFYYLSWENISRVQALERKHRASRLVCSQNTRCFSKRL